MLKLKANFGSDCVSDFKKGDTFIISLNAKLIQFQQ